jgi:hypothetical protein
MSEQQDDADVEVSPLEQATLPSTAANGSDDDPSQPTIPESGSLQTTHRLSLAARRPRRQQVLRAVAALGLLTVLLSALFLIPIGNRAAVLRLLIPPTPSPTVPLQPGDDAFLWMHSVPWGQLLIDGKPGPDVRGSVAQQGDETPQGAVFYLERGPHTLTYRASPFPLLSCRVSVPFSRDDTCPLGTSTDYSFLASLSPLTRILDLQATIDHLPTAPREALTATTQAYVASLAASFSPGTLAVGDHYRDASGQLTQATSAMRLTPQFHLESLVEQQDAMTCVTLCSVNDLGDPLSAQGLAVLAPVALTWRYATPEGPVIISDGPALPAGAVPFSFIALHVGWDNGAWQTPTAAFGAPDTDLVMCPTGEHALSVAQTPVPGSNYLWAFSVPTAELGCVFAGSERDATTGKSSSPMALVLYRAGALIAVNAEAHQRFPTLLVASAHEQALALARAPISLP